MQRPEWWDWQIEFTPHAEDRIEAWGLSELDVRAMLARARLIHHHEARGCWVLRSRHRDQQWEIVVEPDAVEQVVVIITMYRVR